MLVGDKKTVPVHFGDGPGKLMTGRVVYIHPRRVFYIVEFETEIGKIRESYFFPARGGAE